MAHTRLAPSGAALRPLRAFSVTLRSAGQRLAYTALSRSSGDALADALAAGYVTPPLAASVKPAGTPADTMRVFRKKLALADLVE